MLLSPLPRYRIYTNATNYLRFLTDIIFFKTTKGNALSRLEQKVKSISGSPFATCVRQARVGIYLSIKAFIKPGQKVILSPYTIHDVINMVICAGGVPVFADIDKKTCNLDPEKIIELIDDNTGAVMVTHLHGLVMEVKKIASVCKQKNIPLIEDAAQAFGARFNNKFVGTFGDVGIFSFGMYKNLNTFMGGIVISKNENFDQLLRSELNKMPWQDLATLSKVVVNALATDIATSPLLFKLLILI